LFLKEGVKVAIVGTDDEKLAKVKESLGDGLMQYQWVDTQH